MRARRRNANSWLSLLQSGQITPAGVERDLASLRLTLEDQIAFSYPPEQIAATQASIKDAEEALSTGTAAWEAGARKRLYAAPERTSATRGPAESGAEPRTERDEAQDRLDQAKRDLKALRKELDSAVKFRDPQHVIDKLMTDINLHITMVSDAEYDLSRAGDAPIAKPASSPERLALPLTPPPEPTPEEIQAKERRAVAREDLAEINRKIRLAEMDLRDAEQFNDPPQVIAPIQAKLAALHAEAAGLEAVAGKKRNQGRDPLDPVVIAPIECLDGQGPGGTDLWRKTASVEEITNEIRKVVKVEDWVAFLAELVRADALPVGSFGFKKAGFTRVGRHGHKLRSLGFLVHAEPWGESCLAEGLHDDEIPGSGEGRLAAYIEEQASRKNLLPEDDADARISGAYWILSLWLPAAKNDGNYEVVSVDLWEE